MLFPPGIRTIGLFSPAFAPSQEEYRRACALLTDEGYRLFRARNTPPTQRYLAASDQDRADEFRELAANPKIDLLLATRGGYGCARIIPLIRWQDLPRRNPPLPVVGYSDLTALHLAAASQGRQGHICGPMLCSTLGNLQRQPVLRQNLASLLAALSPRSRQLLPDDAKLTIIRPGTATGPLYPANLTVLESLLGTPWLPDFSGAILALEDVGEAAYRIDRSLNHLRQVGVLDKLGGLLFGDFSDCEHEEYLPEILEEYAKLIHGPVLCGLPFGHEDFSISLPVGKIVTLTTEPLSLKTAPRD